MTNETLGLKREIEAMSKDSGLQNEFAQVQARALLQQLTDAPPAIKWSYIPHRVVRNASFLVLALRNIAESNSTDLPLYSSLCRSVALVWEALAKLEEGTDRDSALINAAATYELAGYQANAASIARQIETVVADGQYTAAPLASLFLQRRFVQLADVARRFTTEPDASLLSEGQIASSLARGLIAAGLLDATRFFLRGTREALAAADGKLQGGENLLAATGHTLDANLARTVRALLPVMSTRSIWSLLPGLVRDQPRWLRYLRLLARGIGNDIYHGRSISELWPSQEQALEQGLLDETSSKIVRMPTSAGKTRVAELSIVHSLVTDPGTRCVYLAPFRALVSELQQSFLHLMSDLGFRVASVTGSYDTDAFQQELFQETDLLVTTPEKLDLILRAQPEFLDTVKLFVLDEAQIADDPNRGIKFELLLTRLMGRLPRARFLMLSAVVPDETMADFARWFNASPSQDILTSDWRPSVQRYAVLDWRTTTATLRYFGDDPATQVQPFVPRAIEPVRYEYINPDTRRRNTRIYPDRTRKAQIAAELAFKFAESGPVLVFCTQKNFVTAVANALQEKIQLLRLTDRAVPPYFAPASETRSAALAAEWLGNRPIAKWIAEGIGVHFGDLPDAVRGAVEADFRERNIRVLVATNTLAQGVNLPFRTVIIHSCWRQADDDRQRIPARDYWNIAGRAGRAGEETEGLIVHIVTGYQDTADSTYYLSRRTEVEPVSSALLQRLQALARGRLSEQALESMIDAEVLALLVEEGADAQDAVITDVLNRSLASVQAQKYGLSLSPLIRAFLNVSRSIRSRQYSADLLSAFRGTGLSSDSCEAIRAHIENNINILEQALKSEQTKTSELIELIVPTVLELPEMQSDREVSVGNFELLDSWVNGTRVNDIFNMYSGHDASTDELGKYIDDVFSYRLPWGISAYVRIATVMLGLERDTLGLGAAFLASMIKFGVPDPIATWALTAGVPVRASAVEMAGAFRREVGDVSYESFLRWLGDLDAERLQFDFGLAGTILEDVGRSIDLAGRNPLLREYEGIEAALPDVMEVRGIRYGSRRFAAARAAVGDEVVLRRDYLNTLDRNAVAVELRGEQLGYIPKTWAQLLAPELDGGVEFIATIVELQSGTTPRIRLQVERPH